jgi:glutamine amidotransferase-like uncharacterized protein
MKRALSYLGFCSGEYFGNSFHNVVLTLRDENGARI